MEGRTKQATQENNVKISIRRCSQCTVVPNLLWLIYLVSFAEACLTQFFNPASITLIPQIVGKEHLQEANAFSALSGNICRLIGPSLGGILLSIAGPMSVIATDAISYFFSALMIALVIVPSVLPKQDHAPTASETTPPQPGYRQAWLAGLRVIKQEKILRALFLTSALAALADGMINALLVVFSTTILRFGPAQYGEILTALGIGGLIGSFLIGQFATKVAPTLFVWGGWLGKGLGYLLFFQSHSFLAILLILVVSAIASAGAQVCTQTLLQTTAEQHLLGRVFGAYVSLLSAGLLVGTGIGSVLAAPIGIVPTLDMGGGLFLLAGLLALAFFKTRNATQTLLTMEGEPEPDVNTRAEN